MLYLDLKVRSKEGHSFDNRREIYEAILSHSGNTNPEREDFTYGLEDLNRMLDVELVGILSDFFSVEMEIVK